MTIKLELHNVAVTTTSLGLSEDECGRIPPNLARLTETIVGLHKANGDLSWLIDLASDAGTCKYGILDYTVTASEINEDAPAPQG